MKDTLKFDFNICDFIIEEGDTVTITGINALKMWIEKAIRTHNGYKIYTNYGNNIENLVMGKEVGFGFTESELKREITETLLKNDDINSVDDISITRQKRKLKIEFTISTTYGKDTEVFEIDG